MNDLLAILATAALVFAAFAVADLLDAIRADKRRQREIEDAVRAWRLQALTAERLRMQTRYGAWQEWRWQ
jgi:hypothetical protein